MFFKYRQEINADNILYKNYLIYYNIGNVFAEWKNFPKALFYYNRAIDLNSTNPEIYNAIALLYQDNDDFVE